MNLPTWETLKTNFPVAKARDVFKAIGGKVETNYDIGVFNNACAIRVSKALNGAGGVHVVPYFKAKAPNGKVESQVSSGKAKKWYIFRVRMLVKHLTSRYGKSESLSPSDYKMQLRGRKGIIVFDVEGWRDATGHADLWDGYRCLWEGYGGLATTVLFWEAS